MSLDLISIDFGNSRTKILKNDVIYFFLNNEENYDSKIISLFENTGNYIIGFSSVYNEQSNKITDKLKKFKNIKVINCLEIIDVYNKISYKNIKGMGTDRLLGIIGGVEEFGVPIITVDFGTAITINAVNNKGEVLGGAIFPGLYTQMKSLSEKTQNLKDIELFYVNNPIGTNTESALRAGLINGVFGAVKIIIEKIIYKYFEKTEINIIFTGGDMEIIYEEFKEWNLNIKKRKSLVLDGIIVLLKYLELKKRTA